MRRALVVGMGASGLLASALLARKGWKVTAIGRGTPVSAMSTGCVKGDLNPDCLKQVRSIFQSAGMPLVSGERTGATNIGTRYDCGLSPEPSTWAQGESPKSVTVLGLDEHPSLRPMLAASLLNGWGPQAVGRRMDLKVPMESSPSSFFRSDDMFDHLVDEVQQCSGETVLLPALFTLQDHGRWKELERRSGRKVLEAITPMGEPGLRFVQALEAGAVQAGVELWSGRKVTTFKARGNTIEAAEVRGGLDSRWVETDEVLMASGGPLVDGTLLRGNMEDPFNIFRMASETLTLANGYAHSHGRLMTKDGTIMENVFGAGDCLGCPKREYGQGLAQALNDAWNVVREMEGV